MSGLGPCRGRLHHCFYRLLAWRRWYGAAEAGERHTKWLLLHTALWRTHQYKRSFSSSTTWSASSQGLLVVLLYCKGPSPGWV